MPYLFPSKIWLIDWLSEYPWMDEYVSHFGGIFLSNRGTGDLRSVHFQKISKVGDDGSRDGGVVIFSLPSWKQMLHVTWVKISKHDWIPWILDILGCGSLGKFDEDIFSTRYHPGTLNNHFLILILTVTVVSIGSWSRPLIGDGWISLGFWEIKKGSSCFCCTLFRTFFLVFVGRFFLWQKLWATWNPKGQPDQAHSWNSKIQPLF